MAWYELKLQPDGDTWFVTSPDFEELATFGTSQEDACRKGRDAIEEAIASRIADGVDVPSPLKDTTGNGRFVQLPMMVVLKTAIYMIMRTKGMTRADLQRAAGWPHREQVDRIFKLDHQTKLETIEDAFAALGEPLSVDIPFPNAA